MRKRCNKIIYKGMENNYQQKNQSVYSVSSIVLGSFFGGPLFTLFMICRNAVVFDKKKEVLRVFMVAGAAVLAFYCVGYLFDNFNYLMFWFHDHVWSLFYSNDVRIGNYDPRRYLRLALITYAAVYSALVWLLLNRSAIDNFLKKGGQKKSVLSVFIVSCIGLLAMWVLSIFLRNAFISTALSSY